MFSNHASEDEMMLLSEVAAMLRSAAPELVEALASRYRILSLLQDHQPIGRRNLSTQLGLTERVARKEALILKEQGLVDFSLEGMYLTKKGYDIYELLKRYFQNRSGLIELAQLLEKKLGIRKVILAPAQDSQDEAAAQKELGKVAAHFLKKVIQSDSVIGITGGTTVQSVIDSFRHEKEAFPNAMILPARGGVGNRAEYQANTLVERFANSLGCQYKLLFTPDILSRDTISSLKNEPEIRELMSLIENITVLLFGIGDALTMANRRGLNQEEIGIIKSRGAVAEAFGHYFNREGEIVYEISTIGITLERFRAIESPVAVAGGLGKKDAIVSVCKLHSGLILVTDETVARAILNDTK
jgi:central glycolytic genes regulator